MLKSLSKKLLLGQIERIRDKIWCLLQQFFFFKQKLKNYKLDRIEKNRPIYEFGTTLLQAALRVRMRKMNLDNDDLIYVLCALSFNVH